ncbi:MAG: DUF1801 domain-containing protein [Arenimonas sp.]
MSTEKKPVKEKTAASVEDFMRALEHPLKIEMQTVLELIASASPEISTGIKWNAPSFYCREWFATVNVRSHGAVQIILHLGAKVRTDIKGRIAIEDPNKLLQWLGKDRASVKFGSMQDIKNKETTFRNIISQWIEHLS